MLDERVQCGALTIGQDGTSERDVDLVWGCGRVSIGRRASWRDRVDDQDTLPGIDADVSEVGIRPPDSSDLACFPLQLGLTPPRIVAASAFLLLIQDNLPPP